MLTQIYQMKFIKTPKMLSMQLYQILNLAWIHQLLQGNLSMPTWPWMMPLTGLTSTKLSSWANSWTLAARSGNSILAIGTSCLQKRTSRPSKPSSSRVAAILCTTQQSAGFLAWRTSSGASSTSTLTSRSLAAASESKSLPKQWAAESRRCPTTQKDLSVSAENTSS